MFWEAFRELADPEQQGLLLAGMMDGAPPFCWTCQLPCTIEEDTCHRVVDDRTRF